MTSCLWRLLLVLLFSATVSSVQASHILGGDLAYEPVAGVPNQFRVTARLYQDISSYPNNVSFSDTARLLCSRAGCTPTQAESFSIVLLRNQMIERRGQNCSGASGFTYEMHVFEGLVVLPPATWTLRIIEENRSFGIYNLVESGAQGFHLEAMLNNTSPASRQNTSPRFTTFTLPLLCAQQVHNYSFSAYDADGDSLAYQSAQPLSSTAAFPQPCGRPISYGGPFDYTFTDPSTNAPVTYPAVQLSPALPLLSFEIKNGQPQPLFQLNSATGELKTQPRRLGLATVAVRVDEYRRLNPSTPRVWTHIGSVTRDVVYSVMNAGTNRNPGLTTVSVAGSSNSFINRPIGARPGQTVAVTLTGADPDAGQTIRVSTDATTLIPGLSLSQSTGSQTTITWQVPTTLRPGRYPVAITVADNACPFNGTEVYTLNFEVTAANGLATTATKPQPLATPYPQPFQDHVQFRALAGRVTITDGLGRFVTQLQAPATGWCQWRPAATVPAGIYFARSINTKSAVRLVYAGR